MSPEILKIISFNTQELSYIAAEIFLLSSIVVILLANLFLNHKFKQITYYLSQISLVITAIISWNLLDEDKVIIFSNSFILDYFSGVLKIFIYIFTIVVLVYSRHYLMVHKIFKGEYFLLILFAVFGMMVLASGYSLLTIYIGLEILTISIYTLISFTTDKIKSNEAAIKFFILAAIASGILLYGMSMLYGVVGSINIVDIAHFTNNVTNLADLDLLILNFGLVFIIIGLAFKFGAVPFHMWLPDVYHGAPVSITMFLSTVPKIASLIILMRILIDALGGITHYWQDILMFIAVISIILGSLVAILQTNIKRMLAYSTIAHVGFIILGIATGTKGGYFAATFYTIAYVLTSLAAFGVIIAFNYKNFEAENISDYRALAKRHPFFALMMLIIMLSMAGVPPFIGFYAKFIILQQVVTSSYVWIAILVVIFAVISAYYYLNICKNIYFYTKESTNKVLKLTSGFDMNLVLSINVLLIVVIGILPDYFIKIIHSLF